MSTTTSTTPIALTAAYVALVGLGGAVMPVMLVAVQNVLEADDHGAGTASTNFFRAVGGSFGAAIFGSALIRQLAVHIEVVPGHQQLGADIGPALLNAGGSAIGSAPPYLREAVLLATSAAFDDMFRVGAAISAIALVVTLFMPETRLRTATSRRSAGKELRDRPHLPLDRSPDDIAEEEAPRLRSGGRHQRGP